MTIPSSLNAAIRTEALTLAARPNGMKTHEVTVADRRRASQEIARMCVRKQLFAVRKSVKDARYFTTQKAAQRWATANHVTPLPPRGPMRKPDIVIRPTMTRAEWAGMEAIITPNTKFTICPSPKLGLRTNTFST